jgi:toxin ParE1/3/4
MPRIVRTRLAREDVVEIILRIRRDNRRAARRVLQSINETFELLASFPTIGPDRSELAPRLRSFPVKRYRDYLVFYRIFADGIEIVRVLHGARHLPVIFEDPGTA